MLSSRVDLTTDRDFSRSGSRNFIRTDLDQLAVTSADSNSIHLQMAAGVEEPVFVTRRIYPWAWHRVSELKECWFSDDALSNEMGFEVYDASGRPFLLGDYSARKVGKYLLESDSSDHCDCCGKELSIFDLAAYSLDKYAIIHVCKKCKEDHIRQNHRDDAFVERPIIVEERRPIFS